MTEEREIEIYDHFLELVKKADDLSELERWITRERKKLQRKINYFSSF